MSTRVIRLVDIQAQIDDAKPWEMATIGRVEAARLIEIAEAAHELDREMSEEHSSFDSDGIYERYLRYRAEERLTEALARIDWTP